MMSAHNVPVVKKQFSTITHARNNYFLVTAQWLLQVIREKDYAKPSGCNYYKTFLRQWQRGFIVPVPGGKLEPCPINRDSFTILIYG